MARIIVCNTGTNGKSHARWDDESLTLCGKDVLTPNRGDEDRALTAVECRRCCAAITRKIAVGVSRE